MENRKINQKDIDNIVNNIINEGSNWEGIKGWFRGKGYNYSKYLSEINELLFNIKRKMIQDNNLKKQMDEILTNLEKSSAEGWQKDELKELLTDISETINKTNIKLEKIATKIKKIR